MVVVCPECAGHNVTVKPLAERPMNPTGITYIRFHGLESAFFSGGWSKCEDCGNQWRTETHEQT